MTVSLLILLLFLCLEYTHGLHKIDPGAHFLKTVKMIMKNTQETSENFLEKYSGANNFNRDTSESSDVQSEGSIPIMTLPYYGNWKSSQSISNQFDFFDQETGFAKFWAENSETLEIDNNLFFVFYNGEYIDQKYAIFNFVYDNATDFNPQNATFSNSSIVYNITLFDNFQQVGTSLLCQGAYQLSFTDTANNLPYNISTDSQEYFEVVAQFWLTSTNCSINLSATVAVTDQVSRKIYFYQKDRENKAMDYSIIVTVICVLHLYACMQLIKQSSQNEAEGHRFSLVTIGFLTSWDIFLCLFHLFEALTITDFFHYFITPAFWYFILGTIFETRFLMIIWKTHNHTNFQSLHRLRKAMSIFYIQYYGLLTAFLFTCYYFLPDDWYLYISSLFFIPQIIHNAIRGQRYKINHLYIWCFGFIRIALPIYVKGCPASVFQLTPNIQFVQIYMLIILSQIFILYLQSKIGSRFFIPKCFLPQKFNYYKKIQRDAPCEEACSICMEYLNQEPTNNKQYLLGKGKSKIKIMETPCKHKYHESCLKAWMDIKFECPFCRSKLPPLE